MLMEIDTEAGDISPYGSVDHSEFYNSQITGGITEISDEVSLWAIMSTP